MVTPLANRWDDAHAVSLNESEQLLYRSNLLGADLSITNYGGGNTSAKITEQDPLTAKPVDVLWVKGSGGDLGSIKLDGFSTLYMERLQQLKNIYRGLEFEDEMVGYLPHCTFNLNTRAASIDTPLHAFIPHKHVDHMHPDAIIAIACTANSKALTEEIFEGELGWLPWQRPGFDLGLKLEAVALSNPKLKGVMLQGHGFFSWGTTSKECYQNTLTLIQRADQWLTARNTSVCFGGIRYNAPLDAKARADVAAKLMPVLRGKITNDQYKVGHFNDSAEILEFVNSHQLHELAALGTSCPDHFLRTKIEPLVIDFMPSAVDMDFELARCLTQLDSQLDGYRADYADYYEHCKHADSPTMRDPNAVVYLVPGVGMLTFAKDKSTARIAGEFYVNAINVMREAASVDTYVGLDQQEAFNIEYWLLEEAKLQRMPAPKPLAGRVAFITGGAGGIGKAIALRLGKEGACVMLADIDDNAMQEAKADLGALIGKDQVATVRCDVREESSVVAALQACALAYGGVDMVVANAGIASAAPLDETDMEMWNRNISILTTGYFLTLREGFKILKKQNTGGSVVVIASKNGLVASPNASAYCAAKAAEIQLSRSVAMEGAPLGIRCNVVNPDAVLRGSKIWTGKWREERAAAYNKNGDDLEAHYRERSLLKRDVLPEDVAEAVYFLASDLSAKSTGNIINVDAGNAASFTR